MGGKAGCLLAHALDHLLLLHLSPYQLLPLLFRFSLVMLILSSLENILHYLYSTELPPWSPDPILLEILNKIGSFGTAALPWTIVIAPAIAYGLRRRGIMPHSIFLSVLTLGLDSAFLFATTYLLIIWWKTTRLALQKRTAKDEADVMLQFLACSRELPRILRSSQVQVLDLLQRD